jgi:hypothetical protein
MPAIAKYILLSAYLRLYTKWIVYPLSTLKLLETTTVVLVLWLRVLDVLVELFIII